MYKTVFRGVNEFIGSQSFAGVLLAVAAVLALMVSNSHLNDAYQAFLDVPIELRIGGDWLVLSKPFLIWVNDLWMAVFFFLVGLEIKRELLAGELASPSQVLLPAVAALGGMLVPAILYAAVNAGDAVAMRGWGIPMATDIAFALGILIVLGTRVPVSLKLFLTAVAIIDDLGAIAVIAIFYTNDLSLMMLSASLLGVGVLLLLNRLHIAAIGPYVVVGLVVWVFVLKSGVHATLAGVATALAIPMHDRQGGSPLLRAEHALQPWVAYLILPMFAFANAGLSLAGVSLSTMLHPVSLGIAIGLLVGKAAGVFGASWLLIRLGLARLPARSSWGQFFAVCVLCGIGFTMSLFIGSLAFEGADPSHGVHVKIGVLCGSLMSALLGAGLMLALTRRAAPPECL